jgi:hypothetical protein
MTRALPFTESGLRRAISAARKAGLRVTGIKPDGTLIVHKDTDLVVDRSEIDEAGTPSRWEDVRA